MAIADVTETLTRRLDGSSNDIVNHVEGAIATALSRFEQTSTELRNLVGDTSADVLSQLDQRSHDVAQPARHALGSSATASSTRPRACSRR